jgi:hypothetical protein
VTLHSKDKERPKIFISRQMEPIMQAIDDEAIFWSGKTQKRTVPAAGVRVTPDGERWRGGRR